MALVANGARLIKGLRPCKRVISAIEQNAEASRELINSISNLTETLSDRQTIQRRATDQDEDESWRLRRSML